jgi:Spy/CpxP family protein refolding chaperone
MRGFRGSDPGASMGRLLHVPRVAEEIGLTDEQMQQIRDGEEALREEIQALTEQLQEAAVAQSELLLNDDVDEAALMQQVEETGRVRTEIAKLRMKQVLSLKQILTPEQRDKLRSFMAERKNRSEASRRRPRRRDAAEQDGKPEAAPPGKPQEPAPKEEV